VRRFVVGIQNTLFLVAVCSIFLTAPAKAAGWPEVFDPTVLRTLYIDMTPADWNTVENDMDFSTELPAYFHADTEPNILVAVRRKSGDPIPPFSGGGGPKISLKIDINEYVSGQKWQGINKLSLENGDDNNVLTEGIACNLHQMSSGPAGYGYDSWRGNWVRLIVNGHDYGVYFNAEHLDKQFLQNRGFYVWHETWLYQYRGEYNFTLEIGDDLNPQSPAVGELCYRPFRDERHSDLEPDPYCDPPDDATLVTQLDSLINMQGMLAMAAVNAFTSNPDSLFTHDRNSHFLDFSITDGRKRRYLPWDVDAANFQTQTNIFGSDTGYQTLILGNSVFREHYKQVMCDLIAGPLSEANLIAFIDSIEPVLLQALADDPYTKFGTNTTEGVAAEFEDMRNKLIDRVANVRAQAECASCEEANLDGLGLIDFTDFAILSNDWQLSGPSLAGDVNSDSTVGIADLTLIALNWLSNCQ